MIKYPEQSEKIKEFVRIVCSQVKSKWAHNLLSYELTAHIEDQKATYMRSGIDEFTAEEKAIEEMGDPVAVGSQFNQIHRHRPELLPNIIMWTIAGIIALASIISGTLIFIVMLTANWVIGIISGAAFMIFGFIIMAAFIAIWKGIADIIWGYQLINDYKRRIERRK